MTSALRRRIIQTEYIGLDFSALSSIVDQHLLLKVEEELSSEKERNRRFARIFLASIAIATPDPYKPVVFIVENSIAGRALYEAWKQGAFVGLLPDEDFRPWGSEINPEFPAWQAVMDHFVSGTRSEEITTLPSARLFQPNVANSFGYLEIRKIDLEQATEWGRLFLEAQGNLTVPEPLRA